MWWYDGMGWVGLGEEKVTHIHLWHMVLPQSRRFVVVGAEFGLETDEDSDGKVCEDIAPAVNQETKCVRAAPEPHSETIV